MRPFQNRLGLRAATLGAALPRCQLRQQPCPNVEERRQITPRAVACHQLRHFPQAAFDRVRQAEIRHHPRKYRVRFVAHPAEVIGRRREVHAQVDAANLVHTVQPFDPNRRLPAGNFLLFFVLLVIEKVVFLVLHLGRNAVRVVRFVVDHQDILLAAGPAENARHQRCVAFDVASGADQRPLQESFVRALFLHHFQRAAGNPGFIRGEVEITASARRGGALPDVHPFRARLRHAAPVHPRAAGLAQLEIVPVANDHPAAPEVRHHRLGHQVARAI